MKIRSSYLLFYMLPACVYGSIIFYLSSLSSFPEEMPSFWGFDKIIHFIEYYIFGYLISRCFTDGENSTFRKRQAILWTIGIGVFYAFTDEWHQSFVPGRDPSAWDVLSDALGVTFAALTFQGIRKQVSVIKWMENLLERRMRH